MHSRLNAETVAGLLFVAIGGFFLLGTLGLSYGTPRRLGPGAFPGLVAAVLIGLGLAIAVQGLVKPGTSVARLFRLEGLAVATASIVLFGLTIRGGGLLLAVFVCTMTASLASRPFRPAITALYGLFLGILCSLAFVVGLGMRAPIVGPWFRPWLGPWIGPWLGM